MKIIDFEVKGNAIKFYLGKNDCFDYWGDDWNDAPYEHNAGEVYDEYCCGIANVYVDMNLDVFTPESDWHYGGNSPFCKEDFKKRKAPCIVIPYESSFCDNYSVVALADSGLKFWFEDKMEPGEYFVTSELEIKKLKI